jgi:hypothetical protein
MNEQNIAIGKRLAAVQAASGLRQRDFSESIGIGLRSYLNYTSGERELPLSAVLFAQQQHNINPAWLLTGEGDPTPTWREQLAERTRDLALLREVSIEEAAEHLAAASVSKDPAEKIAAGLTAGDLVLSPLAVSDLLAWCSATIQQWKKPPPLNLSDWMQAAVELSANGVSPADVLRAFRPQVSKEKSPFANCSAALPG